MSGDFDVGGQNEMSKLSGHNKDNKEGTNLLGGHILCRASVWQYLV